MSWLSKALGAIGSVVGGGGSGKPVQIYTGTPPTYGGLQYPYPQYTGLQAATPPASVPPWAVMLLVAVVVLLILRR